MPQETKIKPAPTTDSATLYGTVATRDDEAVLRDALEKAFDYRGDVTVTTTGGDTITGYLFDRRNAATVHDSQIRLLTADDDEPRSVRLDEIASLKFSGKDAAHGKSFDTWIKKYIEKKRAGEEASIFDESGE